jgi:predicted phosphodiesterase
MLSKPLTIYNMLYLKYVLVVVLSSSLLWACSRSRAGEPMNLVRQPYLQLAFADSTTILWRTSSGASAQVRYRAAGDKKWQTARGTTKATNTSVKENEVILTGLRPAMAYQYRIATDGREWRSKQYQFRSPVAATDTTFQFFAVGDIGEPVELEGTPQQLNDALLRGPQDFDLGLLLGDIVYPEGRSEQYDDRLFRHFTTYFPTTPVYPVLGNHDWHDPENNYFKEWKVPGDRHFYNFHYANAHFIALDSGPKGEIYDYDRQLAWLEAQLKNKRASDDWTIVYLHHNGKSCTYKEDYAGVMSLYPLFDRYDVDLVLNGHAHTYERLNPLNGQADVLPNYLKQKDRYLHPEGFISITIGSGGKLRGKIGDPTPFTPDPEQCRHPDLVARAVHDWIYLGVAISGKKLTATAYTTSDNAVVDRFVVEK